MNKENKIKSIFDEIYNLNICGKDPLKVHRDISKMNINSKVMVIAEAMAPEQVRLSGVNYFFKDGTIGNTGKSLEKFLNKFEYTVYPDRPNCVYHTEIVHGFPGYEIKNGKKYIRRPTRKEIQFSIESGILQKEIEIVQPKLILLMGNTAYQSFYTYLLGIKPKNNLTKEIGEISNTKVFKRYMNIPLIPIQHSSGANPRVREMIENKKLIALIHLLVEKHI
jgi:uracil-DNA glycosylase